ncbi:MAG: phosphoglycerate kinase [Maricaulis sp.]|jgi:phosphoglycerate kinase|nr:phosphoglycerate kinase [Maricaulis sp.]HAQ34127.1 phosphoglycerate kinase [Alphaproteobacteria bacterium]
MAVTGKLRRIEDASVEGKRVLVRVDFNVPMRAGQVTDTTRLSSALPTIEYLKRKKAKVILLAHFGRPEGKVVAEESLKPVADALAELMSAPVAFCNDCTGEDAERAISALEPGHVLLLENTRFHKGEERRPDGGKTGDPAFARALAALGDIYVNDAFSAAHRAHASTAGVAEYLPAYAGLAMEREIDHLVQALEDPKRPVMAVVGGAKVSSKIELLANLVKKVDRLFIGGAMANTFLSAQGHDVGASLYEPDFAETALDILREAELANCQVILPTDLVIAREFKENADSRTVAIDAVPAGWMILDCGPETVDALADAVDGSRTLIWNGPLGAFETPPFDTATVEAARYVAKRVKENGLVAVAGGGDTVAALNLAGVARDFTFISTAGGAFLEWMEGKTLPGVEVLYETK